MHHARQVSIALYFTHHIGGVGLALRIYRADSLHQQILRRRLQMANGVLPCDFADAGRFGRGVQPQRQLTGVFFKQQLLGAGKGVGQGITHVFGPVSSGQGFKG